MLDDEHAIKFSRGYDRSSPPLDDPPPNFNGTLNFTSNNAQTVAYNFYMDNYIQSLPLLELCQSNNGTFQSEGDFQSEDNALDFAVTFPSNLLETYSSTGLLENPSPLNTASPAGAKVPTLVETIPRVHDIRPVSSSSTFDKAGFYCVTW
ncbi:hypothetical protein M422DRAFT_49459 [Sphaerobolus stellatus SS14]|uniref:Uncharacterized protein n=1 Tax=Sphaerobolus stellatus (strain SS14) TaxID=990650 RepID=A0A0C9UYM2_SPHS4|nr:hypothetical protein M422DRAFT_49459 [Sphaerobolus stellatus SS14]